MDFSVVVPACQEALYLEDALHSVRCQLFSGGVELIVVCDDRSDRTSHIARGYADRVLYYRERQGVYAARRHGAAKASNENLVFLDPDTEMSPNLLAEAARSLRTGYAGGRAPICLMDEYVDLHWSEIAINRWQRFVGPVFTPYLYCTRAVYQRAGGWQLDIPCAEEVSLQRRIRQHGKLAWDGAGNTSTHAASKRMATISARILGVNLSWRSLRALPAVAESEGR